MGLNAGDVVKVLSTDPGSVEDFSAFCRTTGHELLSSEINDDVFIYIIKKS